MGTITTSQLDPLDGLEVLLAMARARAVTCSAHGLIAVIPRDMPTRVDCPYCAVTR